jgi:polysaccharide pyruvyl transferase WcaK-like protein
MHRPDLAEEQLLHYSPKRAAVRVGLYGMYGSSNLGDTAIQSVVMAALRSRRPDVEFIGVSHDAADVARTHGIAGFAASGESVLVIPQIEVADGVPLKASARTAVTPPAFLRHVLALHNIDCQVRELDMLLISGGGQIDDFWGGPWRQPFRLFTWCLCACRHEKPIAAFAVGVDELRGRLSAWFAIRALQMAQYRTFRDTGSLEVLRDKGLDSIASVCPDPAFGFSVRSGRFAGMGAGAKREFAVISPISRRAFPGASDAEYAAYLAVLANAAEQLLQQGLEVRFACSQTSMDPPVVPLVTARMKTDEGVTVADVKTVDDFIMAVSGAELVIASRLHALILSLVAGVPIISVSPARKVRQQMRDVGLEEYCLDLKSLRAPMLSSRVRTALFRRAELGESISARVSAQRAKLKAAFDELADIIPTSSRIR